MKYLETKNIFKQIKSLRGGSATSNIYITEEEFNKLSSIEKFCYDIYYKNYNYVDIDSDIEEYNPSEFILVSDYNLIDSKYQTFYDTSVLYYHKKEQEEINPIITELTKDKKNNEISEEEYSKLNKSIQFLYYKNNKYDEINKVQETKYILNNPFLFKICQTK